MIDRLVETGYAYEKKGSVYYRVDAFKGYGKLARLKMQGLEVGAGGFGPNDRRGSDDKESGRDFALWKSFNRLDKDVVWDSSFGRGRPGWHIECSAMCYKHLGETIDIHAGGVDLVFPHHENEIAQSEAYTGKTFSNYWIHNGFVNINDEKMSKSLKNFKTLRDIAVSPFDARAFRFMVVTSQYRSPLNFNPDTLKAASNSLKRIDKLMNNLVTSLSSVIDHTVMKNEMKNSSHAENTEDTDFDMKVVDYIKTKDEETNLSIKSALLLFEDSMCDDMNTPRAVAALFQIVSMGEKLLKSGGITRNQINLVLRAIAKIDIVFGVFYDVPTAYFNPTMIEKSDIKVPIDINLVPENILLLANKRMDFKIAKDFQNSDLIRKELTSLGYEVIDRKFEFDIYEI